MEKIIRTVCPLDCIDSCSLLVHVSGGRAVKIEGDPTHPVTRGFICSKGRKHIQRLYSQNRLQRPLLRRDKGWQEISWDAAYSLMAEEFTHIKEQYGSTAVLHHDASGHNGLLRKMAERFFNAYGGVTVPKGSLCWGSGFAAQQYDFGGLATNSWEDLQNANTIILWGRDPAATNQHLIPFLKEAAVKGAFIITINPIKTASTALADLHVSPRTGTDGALALGMAHVIISEGLLDQSFLNNNVLGYEKYHSTIVDFTPERAAAITGIPVETIVRLARIYAGNKPSAIMLGYGLQRYANGGSTVRCIDALAAITGNIGIPGGGVNYCHQHWRGFFQDISGKELAAAQRELPWPRLAQAILEANDPPVKSIVVTRSNPVTQLPNTAKVLEAFETMDFVVVVDQFMTDTAQMAHLVLPCTHFLEDEDVVYSSWSNYLFHAAPAVEPLGQCKPDYQIFNELAGIMNLPGFPQHTPEDWLEYALAPAASAHGITLDKLRSGPVHHPGIAPVAWANKQFATPSGKYELYSEKAAREGNNPLPRYVEPAQSPVSTPELAAAYPLRLVSSHHRDFLHTQFQNLDEKHFTSLPEVEIHPEAAAARGIAQGDEVIVISPQGQMKGRAKLTDRVRRDLIQVFQGRWLQHGGGINLLTPDIEPDLGLGAPYYDCLCQVEKLNTFSAFPGK